MDVKTVFRNLQEKKITPEEAKIQIELLKKQESVKKIDEKCKGQMGNNPPLTIGNEKIAVIGMSGRYPKSVNMNQYWDNLKNGVDGICEVPKSRWDMTKYYDSKIGKKGRVYCKWMGMIEDIEFFDPLFFEITPSEAEEMDPQHRLFLEEGYKAFEEAGYTRRKINGEKCGVYFGIVDNEYTCLSGNNSSTGNSNAIGASRIAYYLNLKGPAIAINTACSSSMVGVHLAIQALKLKEIDMALVGGACLYLAPESYVSMCETGMLSKSGKCKTFDNTADGFVPGEGVGALVLKRLSDAERDGDHIHGVIIASGMNQDGKTNGITAPNLGSQYELEKSLYKKNGIDPESITYAEFHGTGTKLGDPIELEALESAFREDTSKKNYCAIGSVKSNLGHTSAAGGIAGIEKILLCMKHKKLVPTINVKVPNEHFDFKNSPFYINTGEKEWNTSDGAPLRACISSFGFSGTNVHLVLEEYSHKKRLLERVKKINNIFILSAKNKTQLKCYVKEMLDFLNKNKVIEEDFFYTLQECRDAMEERIAISTDGLEGLKEKLTLYLIEKSAVKGLYENHLSRNTIKLKEASYLMNKKQDNYNLHGKESEELAKKWIEGEIINWKEILYKNMPVQKISIPVYPFEKQAYWIKKEEDKKHSEQLHPLIHKNISDFNKQCFESDFSIRDVFISDHKVGNQFLLPGTAMIEMARIAAVISSGDRVTALKDIEWLIPIEVNEKGRTVKTELVKNRNDVEFYIMTEDKCCARGLVTLETEIDRYKKVKSFDVNEIRSLLPKKIKGKEFYEKALKGRISYGNSFQVIDEIWYGKNEALAHFTKRDMLNHDEYIIHPECLDGAMQIVSTLITSNDKTGVYLPFLMEELVVHKSVPIYGYAYAVEVVNRNREKNGICKFNIVVADENGDICIEIRGINLRQIGERKTESERMLYLHSDWMENELKEDVIQKAGENDGVIVFTDSGEFIQHLKTSQLGSYCKNIIWIKESNSFKKESSGDYSINISDITDYCSLFEDLKKRGIITNKIIINHISKTKELDTEERIKYSFEGIFLLVKAFIKTKLHNKVKLLYLIGDKDKQLPEESALSGMFRDINTENKQFMFNTICIGVENILELGKELVKEFSAEDISSEIYYSNGQRFVKRFSQVDIEKNIESIPVIKNGGVYVITGGLGGIGLITAEYITRYKNVKVILTGRREISESEKQKIDRLSKNSSEVVYLKNDITNKKDVIQLINSIKKLYGKINGVIHSAGIKKDGFIYKKTMEEARTVINPKVFGTINLDEALAEENIDFMVLYSSIASVLGNIGQCDYCYANSFMDQFAIYRNYMVQKGARYGKTISINWPFWEDGGMKIDEEFKKFTEKQNGNVPINAAEGMEALEVSIRTGVTPFTVLKGKESRLRSVFLFEEQNNIRKKELYNVTNEQHEYNEGKEILPKRTISYIKDIISKVTKIQVDKIDEEVPFGDYGIDSIVILKLTRNMEEVFGELSKTLFFEYNTVKELADYLMEEHRSILTNMLTDKNEKIGVTEKHYGIEENELINRNFTRKKVERTDIEDDIAIIGMSGKYPMADNLEEYWNNLMSGKDCITEIPKERWDYNKYYNPERNKIGAVYSKWGGFINDVDKFDPLFFNIPPIEAEFIDPQVRLYLESAWNAMEDSGYTRESLKKDKVGVFVGVMYGMYQLFEGKIKDAIVPASASYSAIANRVSYFFDFHGPSMAVDTMCSSSLTAVHLACNSLKNGESDVAFVGGVNLSIHPKKYQILSFGQFVSTDGRCRSFGEGGDGYVPGEGVGTVILKSLKKAKYDKDHIYAVIKGSAINSGGKTSGATVPSPIAQSEVIASVYNNAGIDVNSVSYIETHGTGTSLGDPIEISGLNKIFNNDKRKKQSCSIGSVKSNIGHLEGAAGIASLTKVILQMQNKKLLPSIHSKKLNNYINFKDTPFYVQQELEDWNKINIEEYGKTVTIPRRAGISSFGAGGSNAHILVEEYEKNYNKEENMIEEKYLYVFSAKKIDRLTVYIRSFVEQFRQNKSIEKNLDFINELFSHELGINKEEINSDTDIQEYGLDLEHSTVFLNWLIQEKEINMLSDDLKNLNTIRKLALYIAENSKQKDEENTRKQREIAYTLQIGREAMEERLAIISGNLSELYEKLEQWLNREQLIDNIYHNNILDYKDEIEQQKKNILEGDTIEQLIKRKDYEKLAMLWTRGVRIDWKELYDEVPYKVSLPGYSFAKEHYWVKEPDKVDIEDTDKIEYIHPMLHKNISDISGLKFKTHFKGDEEFLLGHSVLGENILPGVAYFEIIHAAVNSILGKNNTKKELLIQNIAWMIPAVVKEDGLTLYTSIRVTSKKILIITICSDEKMEMVNCQASIILEEPLIMQNIDLNEIKSQCDKKKLSGEEIYKYIQTLGINYGELFRKIDTIYKGNEMIVARLEDYENTASELLSIGIIDAALQSAIGFDFTEDSITEIKKSPELPFMVERVEIIEPCKKKMWAVLNRISERKNGSVQKKVNIQLCDEKGKICIRLINVRFSSKRKEDMKNKQRKSLENVLVFKTVWKEKKIEEDRML